MTKVKNDFLNFSKDFDSKKSSIEPSWKSLKGLIVQQLFGPLSYLWPGYNPQYICVLGQ